MRLILLSVVVLFLAAGCSGTGGSAPARQTGASSTVAVRIDPAAVTPEYVASLPGDQATAAVDSMTDHYLALVAERCPVRTDACVTEQFEPAFDPTGQLAPLCEVNEERREYNFCLMIAAETAPMVTAAGGNPATDIDWSDVDSTNNAARKQFAEFLAKRCGSDQACVVDQAAALLGLSPAVAKSCQLHATPSDRMNCISDAKSAEVYQRAIKSLS